MIVKKYQAPTETQAILLAKEELGNSAVVLNSKTIKQRGIMRLFKKDVVEITAALEEKEFVQAVNEKKPTFQSKIDVLADDEADKRAKNVTVSSGNNAIEAKLESLHSLLKEQMQMTSGNSEEVKAEGEVSENANIKFLKLIYNKMIDNEVDEKYVNLIIEEIENSIKKEATLDSILSAVYQKIILKLDEPATITVGDRTKVVFSIGPTGVGKTTTIAKLASKYKINEGKKIAFITSDTYRIAAVEQLNTYASILDIPVKVIYSPGEITEALNEFKKFDMIFIDTAGRSHKDEKQKNELFELINSVDENKYDVEKYLVLSVTTKYKDLLNIVDAFKEVTDYRILFTKLDETMTLGNILNIKLYTGASLSYTTYGQNVPDDIEVTNVQKLAKQLLGGNEV